MIIGLKCATCAKEVCDQSKHLKKINEILEKENELTEEEISKELFKAQCKDYVEIEGL